MSEENKETETQTMMALTPDEMKRIDENMVRAETVMGYAHIVLRHYERDTLRAFSEFPDEDTKAWKELLVATRGASYRYLLNRVDFLVSVILSERGPKPPELTPEEQGRQIGEQMGAAMREAMKQMQAFMSGRKMDKKLTPEEQEELQRALDKLAKGGEDKGEEKP